MSDRNYNAILTGSDRDCVKFIEISAFCAEAARTVESSNSQVSENKSERERLMEVPGTFE